MSDGGAAEAIERALGYRFRDSALAELALAHPSYSHEVDGTRGNERLEFLGDAVLDLVISEAHYRTHAGWSEGDMSRARAALVNKRALAQRARTAGLDRLVRLGRTERRSAGQGKDSVLANCLEAVLGAIYLDGGLAAVGRCVDELFGEDLYGSDVPERRDVKTRFQEWAHEKLRATPVYRTVRDSGTENDPERFTVEALVGDEVWGRGAGRSKREAEREAAADAVARATVSND